MKTSNGKPYSYTKTIKIKSWDKKEINITISGIECERDEKNKLIPIRKTQ